MSDDYLSNKIINCIQKDNRMVYTEKEIEKMLIKNKKQEVRKSMEMVVESSILKVIPQPEEGEAIYYVTGRSLLESPSEILDSFDD